MSTMMQSNDIQRCIEPILNVSPPISIPIKRWHFAFATIYCSRALYSHFKQALSKKHAKYQRSPSYTILNVEQEPPNLFKIDQNSLVQLMKQKNVQQLDQLGGLGGIASALDTDLENGVRGDDAEDIACRHEAFGSNTYSKPPTKSLFHFVWEAFKDPTILILLVCAALSLGFGIKQHGPKEGWYDGGSIFVAVFLVITVSGASNFRQNKQFDKLSEAGNNIRVDVVRGGRRQEVSVFEIVIGDVVCLKIGDQVPADGLFIDGHSFEVDESSMTGESDHVQVNHNQNPFLISGTKVMSLIDKNRTSLMQ